MPLYEYECVKCGHRAEVIQRLNDPPLDECAECGGAMKRLISAPAVQFKGSGWYVTDYANKKGAPPKEEKPDKPKSDGGGGESKSSESKSKESGGKKAAAAASAD